jgi:hypothetical protein
MIFTLKKGTNTSHPITHLTGHETRAGPAPCCSGVHNHCRFFFYDLKVEKFFYKDRCFVPIRTFKNMVKFINDSTTRQIFDFSKKLSIKK